MTNNTNNEVQTSTTASESIKTPESVMMKPLQPRFCIQRDDNTVVPLIAMDELPESVILKGVPTTLTVLDALKGRMELIRGDHPAHGVRYQLYHPLNTQVHASEQGDDSGSDGSPTSEGSASTTKKGFKASDKKGNKNMKDKAQKHPTLTTNDTSVIDPLANKGTIGKKVYCTYWIQTGNCNYMQEGCKYKHEIPEDEETRRAIGFRESPKWPRDEMPIRPAPVFHKSPPPALHKSWRRQDGKREFPGAAGQSNRVVASPATAHGRPNNLARGNSQPSAGASPQPTTNNAHYYPNVTAFMTPHQHFPTNASHAVQQGPLSHGGQRLPGPISHGGQLLPGAGENYQPSSPQNNASLPSYNQSASQIMNAGHSNTSTPPKQPPISRPSKLGLSPVSQQQQQQPNTNTPTRRVAPDHHIVERASGLSGGGASATTGNLAPIQARPVYSGMQGNWNQQTSAPTSMDISFIAPASESTRSGSQAVYTPNYTPSNASATPTIIKNNAFAGLNGNTKSDSRAGTPSRHHNNNNNAFSNNGNARVKGRGPTQYGRNSPAPSTGSARNPVQTSLAADESDATSITSPPVQHRVLFRDPGQPEFVSNPPEPKHGKAAHGLKKHGRKSHAAKSAKSKMSGNGYDVLVDTHDQH